MNPCYCLSAQAYFFFFGRIHSFIWSSWGNSLFWSGSQLIHSSFQKLHPQGRHAQNPDELMSSSLALLVDLFWRSLKFLSPITSPPWCQSGRVPAWMALITFPSPGYTLTIAKPLSFRQQRYPPLWNFRLPPNSPIAPAWHNENQR